MSDTAPLADVLAEVDGWKPDTVAVGATSPSATLATHGPTGEVLELASLTKPLAAYATLIAVRDGHLHLDEPAGPKADEGATVRHLLAHASGLPFEEGGVMTTAPAHRRIYSNWGYEVLGALVADRLGEPFSAYLAHEVFAPLGMTDSVLEGSPARDGRATVDDLLAFARELLAPTLLDADELAEITAVAWPDLDGVVPGYGRQSPCPWGLGVEIKGAKDPHWTGTAAPPEAFGHFGQSGSFLLIDPSRQVALVELADRAFGSWAKDAWPDFTDRALAAASAEAS